MKTSSPSKLERLIHGIASAATLEPLWRRFDRWLDAKFHPDIYVLVDGEIIAGSGKHPKERVLIENICHWQETYIGGGVPFISIELTSGQIRDWDDRRECLYKILRKVAPDKELPFVTY